jgi:hypothetical protein
VLRKRARYSGVFGDEASSPSADFEQFSIVAHHDMSHFQQLRALLPTFFGEVAASLKSEGNRDLHTNAGVCFHGDRRCSTCGELRAQDCWADAHLCAL